MALVPPFHSENEVHCGVVWRLRRTAKIAKIKSDIRNETVYNFEVKDNHNYFVSKDKILVHNSEQRRCK